MTLKMLFPPIINEDGKKHILAHKYVPGTKSLVMPYLDIWWEIAVKFVPSWIAPNVLTLCSLVISLSGLYIYCFFDSHFSGTYQSFYLYSFECIALFTYQTLDAIDGKHARNTKNSSPLGQLFDHGCDAILITQTCMHAGIVGIGTNWKMLYIIIMSQIVFYALNWRARHTGQFDFGLFSVDETCLLGMFNFAIAAIYGTDTCKNMSLFGISVQNLLLISLSFSILQNCSKAFYHVNKHYNKETNDERRKFYNERFYELGNVFIFHISICLWNIIGIFDHHPILFVTTIAFTFAHLIHRLIICDVTKQKSRKIQYIILPFVVIGIISVFEYKNGGKPVFFYDLSMKDIKVMIGVFGYSTYIMLNYAIRCMVDISNILDIRIFLINKPKIHNK